MTIPSTKSHVPKKAKMTIFLYIPHNTCFHMVDVLLQIQIHWSFPDGNSGKESTCQCWRHRAEGSVSGWGRSPGKEMGKIFPRKIPRRRKWHSTPVFLFGKLHEQRSLVGYSPWGSKEPDTTEQLRTHKQIN